MKKIGYLDVVVMLLSIYVLIALVVDTFIPLSPQTSKLINHIDNIICIFFFFEFFYRLFKSEDKLKFLKWGWIDLLSAIPMIPFLRYGRVIRLIRLIRIVRAFKSIKGFLGHLFENKKEGTFTSMSVIAIVLVIFSAIAILQVETSPESNIKTAEDAIWWSYVTITTVGYGDKYPVTTEGRFIAAILMTAGVGLFGTFTAFIASWFVSDDKKSTE